MKSMNILLCSNVSEVRDRLGIQGVRNLTLQRVNGCSDWLDYEFPTTLVTTHPMKERVHSHFDSLSYPEGRIGTLQRLIRIRQRTAGCYGEIVAAYEEF